VGSDPSWNSPERPSNEDNNVDEIPSSQDIRGLGYLEYCENIQEEGGAFYQIGSDLFVVNGWDTKKKLFKVRVPISLKFLRLRIFHSRLGFMSNAQP
jgi:hypothetical protein